MRARGPGGSRVIATLLALTAGVAMDASATETAEAKGRTLEIGFLDDGFSDPNPLIREEWHQRAVSAGADLVAVSARWFKIETEPPAEPGDPSDPAYNWEDLDQSVRDAAAAGLSPMLTVRAAPTWAEGPNRDPAAPFGSWRPDPGKLADFVHALAVRYSGSYADPLSPGVRLPAVRLWQIWTEPNINRLTPQWVREGDKWKLESALQLRELVSAAYPAIKGVSPASTVAAGLTSPFGAGPGSDRAFPLTFWKKFLCLKGKKKLRKGRCEDKVFVDAIGNNPLALYAGVGPWKRGKGGDLLVPDFRKLRRLLRAAKRAKTIKPRGGTQLWAGEFFWPSDPPSSNGVSLAKQAKYLADSLYLFWKQRVSRAFWVGLVDDPAAPGTRPNLSGLYFADGRPKPALAAMQFPFAAERLGGRKDEGETAVWGKAPSAGKVKIQRSGGSGWKTVARLRAKRSRIFFGTIPGKKKAKLRASIGGETSFARKPR